MKRKKSKKSLITEVTKESMRLICEPVEYATVVKALLHALDLTANGVTLKDFERYNKTK